jgi:hypothetical protein
MFSPSEQPNDAADYLGVDWRPTTHLKRMLQESRAHSSHHQTRSIDILQGPTVQPTLAFSRHGEHSSGRQSHHTLPHLSIPQHGHAQDLSPSLTPDTSQTVTPDTPVSLSSPIAGVIDLTSSVKTLNDSPATTGGFSDIYRGEWTKERAGQDQGSETVLVSAFYVTVILF